MHTAYLDTSKGYPQIATKDIEEGEALFEIYNLVRDIDALKPAELHTVVSELKPETLKRLYAAIVDHKA